MKNLQISPMLCGQYSVTRWKLRYTNTFDKLITKRSCISMHWLKISYQGLDAGVINT